MKLSRNSLVRCVISVFETVLLARQRLAFRGHCRLTLFCEGSIADVLFFQRGRAYIISSEPLDTPLSGREMYGCNCYASGVSYFTEEVMQNVYKPMLDYFQLIADVPGYEEVECFVAVPADGEDDVPVEEVQTGGD